MRSLNNPFNDKTGKTSITRLLACFLIVNAIAMGWATLLKGNTYDAIAIISSVTSIASGWKLIKDNEERKEKNG